jgi:hypothetical protein
MVDSGEKIGEPDRWPNAAMTTEGVRPGGCDGLETLLEDHRGFVPA